MKLHPQYVTDNNGERTGVILPLEEFRRMVEVLEDQLDATDLDDAAAKEKDFVPYDQVREDLRAESRVSQIARP